MSWNWWRSKWTSVIAAVAVERFSKTLSLTAAYTWSHLIDDAGQTINAGGCNCQNPRNRGKSERASSVLDQRQRAVFGYV
jgi:hypothetical protein